MSFVIWNYVLVGGANPGFLFVGSGRNKRPCLQKTQALYIELRTMAPSVKVGANVNVNINIHEIGAGLIMPAGA